MPAKLKAKAMPDFASNLLFDLSTTWKEKNCRAGNLTARHESDDGIPSQRTTREVTRLYRMYLRFTAYRFQTCEVLNTDFQYSNVIMLPVTRLISFQGVDNRLQLPVP